MTDIGGHLPADDVREIMRNERRDRKRITKMVMDGAGVRRLRAAMPIEDAINPHGKAVNISDGKVGNRGGRNRPKR
jgi:hypothetical protein